MNYSNNTSLTQETINEEGGLYTYRTEIPNIVFDEYALNPYEFFLYAFYKRVAGNKGRCYYSTPQIAKKLSMSVGKVAESRQSLAAKGLVRLKAPYDSKHAYEVTIVDIWKDNFSHYGALSPHESGVTPHESGVSSGESGVTPHETKKQLIKKQPKKKQPIEEEGAHPSCHDVSVALTSLSHLPGYPQNTKENLKHLEKRYQKHKDALNFTREVQNFCEYYEDKGFRKGERPRAKLTTWLNNAAEWKPLANGNNGKEKREYDKYDPADPETEAFTEWLERTYIRGESSA